MARNLFEYHPVIGYRFIPSLRARVRHEGGGYLVETNPQGFRCRHPLTPQKPADTFRVILFGDSNAAGQGVSNRDRFSDLLEQRIPGLQILNFGLPGSGTDQQYLAWREYAHELEYDLLLLAPLVGTIRRNVQTHRLTQSAWDQRLVLRAKPYFEREGDDLALHHQPVPKKPVDPASVDPRRANVAANTGTQPDPQQVRQNPRQLISRVVHAADRRIPGILGLSQKARRLQWPTEYNDPDHRVWRMMTSIVTRWADECPAPFLLGPIPSSLHIQGRVRGENYLARFRELGAEIDADVVDILPAYLEQRRRVRKTFCFPTDKHPNPVAHGLIADALEDTLRARVEAWRSGR